MVVLKTHRQTQKILDTNKAGKTRQADKQTEKETDRQKTRRQTRGVRVVKCMLISYIIG